jgi:hypothetical protein
MNEVPELFHHGLFAKCRTGTGVAGVLQPKYPATTPRAACILMAGTSEIGDKVLY